LKLRDWKDLSKEEKINMWHYLKEEYFFSKDPVSRRDIIGQEIGNSYEFFGNEISWPEKQNRIFLVIHNLNQLHKKRSYANNFIIKNTNFNACRDFYRIFEEEKEDAAIEMLSLYAKFLIPSSKNESPVKNNKKNEERKKKMEAGKWLKFDKFAEDLNEIFSQFQLNLILSRCGFIPRQDEKIIKEIYEPVLKSLSHEKWKEVSKILSDSFVEYKKLTPQSCSSSVTHTFSSVQAFLQILVYGKTGRDEISNLLPEAQKRNLIPADSFSKQIFKNIESILMQERQKTGDSHPKREYATEKNARLVLNLAMIFFQHCLQ
jgi:hypothetical protein